MTRFLLVAIAAQAFALFVFILLFAVYRKSAKKNKELYKAERERSQRLREYIETSEKANRIKDEERRNAEEKINAANTGTARERFDAINSGLRKRTD